jgi:hypothetical protein
MRLTSLAAGIFAVAITGYVGVTTVAPAKGAGTQDSASTQTLVSGDVSTDPSARAANGFRQPIELSQSNQQQEPQGQGPLRVQTTIVNVFATARDKRHAIVTDLTKDDFKILEDGVEQKVAFFSKEVNMPITLGLLIDTSASMDRMIEAEQDAASRFLREVMRPKDEAMVITFDFDVDLLADFTQDTSVLASAIRRNNSAGQFRRDRSLRRDLSCVPRRTRQRSRPQGRNHFDGCRRYREQVETSGCD